MKTRSGKFQAPAPTTNNPAQASGHQLPTFLDHVHELRRRLFWIIATILVASSVAYSFLGPILDILTLPLGDERLFYLTPGGGLSFSFKLCALVGLLVGVPIIMYHLYRFMEPLMGNWRRSTIFYVGFSTLLAVAGVLFAYYVSLPAAIKFLTGFNVNHIQAMLTADSYLSFVATYLLGAALLFQIPLLLMIINTMTPLKPSKLMKLQKFVIVGAFILAAMISPTPDVMNQAFLAVPIIAMYQLGVILVWIQNNARARKQARAAQSAQAQQVQPQPMPPSILEEFAMQQRAQQQPVAMPPAASVAEPATRHMPQRTQRRPQPNLAQHRPQPKPMRVFSDITPRPAQAMRPVRQVRPAGPVPAQRRPVVKQAPAARAASQLAVPARSVDGFTPYRTANVAATS